MGMMEKNMILGASPGLVLRNYWDHEKENGSYYNGIM